MGRLPYHHTVTSGGTELQSQAEISKWRQGDQLVSMCPGSSGFSIEHALCYMCYGFSVSGKQTGIVGRPRPNA